MKHPVKHVETKHSLVKRNADEADLCTTPTCVAHAKEIKTYLAPNYTAIDPCTDFDEYSCAGWRATHNFRPEQSCESFHCEAMYIDSCSGFNL
jgi:endothelin-converting enzyme